MRRLDQKKFLTALDKSLTLSSILSLHISEKIQEMYVHIIHVYISNTSLHPQPLILFTSHLVLFSLNEAAITISLSFLTQILGKTDSLKISLFFNKDLDTKPI